MTIQTLAKPEGECVCLCLVTGSCRPSRLTLRDRGHRRTGITLKEGKRDEHGMEDIEGMWSSPENSPSQDDGASEKNDDSIGSGGMSMDEGMCNALRCRNDAHARLFERRECSRPRGFPK